MNPVTATTTARAATEVTTIPKTDALGRVRVPAAPARGPCLTSSSAVQPRLSHSRGWPGSTYQTLRTWAQSHRHRPAEAGSAEAKAVAATVRRLEAVGGG